MGDGGGGYASGSEGGVKRKIPAKNKKAYLHLPIDNLHLPMLSYMQEVIL